MEMDTWQEDENHVLKRREGTTQTLDAPAVTGGWWNRAHIAFQLYGCVIRQQ